MNSLEKLVIGVVVARHGYDPTRPRSGVHREIEEELERVGMPLDEDTIRTRLRDAAGAYGHLLKIGHEGA